jgi:response regulator RpfG family c-di-GMP phosphodiesterase
VYRLVDEYKKYGSLVIAYDFDNCIYDYHSKGHNYFEVIELIKKAKEINCFLIVFTAEKDLDKVTSFLNDNRIPYDSINENPPFFKSDARKIYFNLLLDDRAGLLSAYTQLKETIEIIKNQI